MSRNIKSRYRIGLILIVVLSLFTLHAGAEDLKRILGLSGNWKFSVGDFPAWANPGYDDSDWDIMVVPGKWEDHGYSDYNGFAWYRKRFTIESVDENTILYLILGRIDDADEVYLNGKKLSGSGSMPPNFRTAYNERRKYHIPIEYLNFTGANILAVRVYDNYLEGGIIDGPVGIYIDEDNNLLDYDLSGKWKFHLGDNKQWKEGTYSDELWSSIEVPIDWEHNGYNDYNGYAWYRKKFKLPEQLKNKSLYLILGKIDDYDYVYLNGELIGNVFELEKDGEYKRKGYEYNARRIYKIPPEKLNQNGVNTIAVRVFDSGLRGGIYEGPIGLMTEDNCRLYRRKHYENQSFWDYIIDEFLID